MNDIEILQQLLSGNYLNEKEQVRAEQLLCIVNKQFNDTRTIGYTPPTDKKMENEILPSQPVLTINEQMVLLFVQKLFENTNMVNYYDSELKNIFEKYWLGELDSDIDEKGAGGFWDLAGELETEYNHIPLDQGVLYNAMITIYEMPLKTTTDTNHFLKYKN